nr:DUF935 family protein [Desulfobacula sp.]
MKIYDQFNRPVQKMDKKPDRRPLATAPLTDGFRDYVADGLTPGGLAAVLKQADAGDIRSQAELFDQLEERDAHILGEISKRKNVILSAQFKVRPAGRSPRDKKIAEDVSMMFQNITDWEDVLLSMQDAVGKGFSAFELKWDTSEGQAAVSNFDFIEQKRFIFKDNSFNPSVIPKLITDKSPWGLIFRPLK